MQIHTLLVGQPRTIEDGEGSWHSAIFRMPVDGPIELTLEGLAGDQVADVKNHGTPGQAVCCHPLAHYAYWNDLYALAGTGRALGPGSVGENWTVTDAVEADVCIGDIYAVGSARVQVTAPRYPCWKQERKVQLPGFLQRTKETMRTGWYLRVLEPGIVQRGQELRLVERVYPELTIERTNRSVHGELDVDLAQQMLDVPELFPGWKRILLARLNQVARA